MDMVDVYGAVEPYTPRTESGGDITEVLEEAEAARMGSHAAGAPHTTPMAVLPPVSLPDCLGEGRSVLVGTGEGGLLTGGVHADVTLEKLACSDSEVDGKPSTSTEFVGSAGQWRTVPCAGLEVSTAESAGLSQLREAGGHTACALLSQSSRSPSSCTRADQAGAPASDDVAPPGGGDAQEASVGGWEGEWGAWGQTRAEAVEADRRVGEVGDAAGSASGAAAAVECEAPTHGRLASTEHQGVVEGMAQHQLSRPDVAPGTATPSNWAPPSELDVSLLERPGH